MLKWKRIPNLMIMSQAGGCIWWIFTRDLSATCWQSLCSSVLFFCLPLPYPWYSSPFFCPMSFFFPLLSSHLPPLFFTSSPLLSHSPFIKFNRKLKEAKHVKFPRSQPHSFSSSQSLAASAATSNHIPSLPSLCPFLSLSHPLIKLSPMSLKFQCMCHTAPRLSPPLFFPRSVFVLFTRYSCSSFLYSPLTVTQHRLLQGGDEHGERGWSYVRVTQTRPWEDTVREMGRWRNPN